MNSVLVSPLPPRAAAAAAAAGSANATAAAAPSLGTGVLQARAGGVQLLSSTALPSRLSPAELAYVSSGVAANLRADGRSRLDYRAFSVETGVVPHANGSARLRLGEGTDVLAAVNLSMIVPDQTATSAQGSVVCSVEHSAACAVDREDRDVQAANANLTASDNSTNKRATRHSCATSRVMRCSHLMRCFCMSSCLPRRVRVVSFNASSPSLARFLFARWSSSPTSKCGSSTSMCCSWTMAEISSTQSSWPSRPHCSQPRTNRTHCICATGAIGGRSPLKSHSVSLSCLFVCRSSLPPLEIVTGDGGAAEIIVNDDPFSHVPLAHASRLPLAVTLAKIGGAEEWIIDATADEEQCASMKLTLSLDPKGNMCGLSKAGVGTINLPALDAIMAHAAALGVQLNKLLVEEVRRGSGRGDDGDMEDGGDEKKPAAAAKSVAGSKQASKKKKKQGQQAMAD